MSRKILLSHLRIVVMFGAAWGLTEAALGMSLRNCASFVSGSLMTGVALFFIAATWIRTKHILSAFLLIVVASLFKMFDALLLSLPLRHGAVANPIFAFWMEGLAFLILMTIVKENLKQKLAGQALTGAMAALLAANLFPLVKYATGIPACVFPGTGYPLSLYYAPLAAALSFLTVPFGLWVGARAEALVVRLRGLGRARDLSYVVSPAILILCFAIIVLIRLG